MRPLQDHRLWKPLPSSVDFFNSPDEDFLNGPLIALLQGRISPHLPYSLESGVPLSCAQRGKTISPAWIGIGLMGEDTLMESGIWASVKTANPSSPGLLKNPPPLVIPLP